MPGGICVFKLKDIIVGVFNSHMLKGVDLPPGHSFCCHIVTAGSYGKRFGDFSLIWQGYKMVQVYYLPVIQYGGSKPEVGK